LSRLDRNIDYLPWEDYGVIAHAVDLHEKINADAIYNAQPEKRVSWVRDIFCPAFSDFTNRRARRWGICGGKETLRRANRGQVIP